MKTVIFRIMLAIGALLMFFRFGGPALIYGTTGPGPLGEPWMASDQHTTLLLDADLRFFGALILGIGLTMITMMRKIETQGTLLRIVAGSVFVGALARLYALYRFGSAGSAGTIPIAIELTLPVALVVLQAMIRRDRETQS